MSYKKYSFLGAVLLMSLCAGTIFAHGGEGASEGALHPETQIGMSGAAVGADALATSSGMTREEVAALIQDIQEPEEARSLIKLTLLALAIAGVIQLYSPRKLPVNSETQPVPQVSSQTPEST